MTIYGVKCENATPAEKFLKVVTSTTFGSFQVKDTTFTVIFDY